MFWIYCLRMAVQRHLDSLSFFLDLFFTHSNFGSNIYIIYIYMPTNLTWHENHKSYDVPIPFQIVFQKFFLKYTILNWCSNLLDLNSKSWKPNSNYPNFNSEFWIAIQTIQISIQNSELKSKLSKFQFRILIWNSNYPKLNWTILV